MAYDYVVLTPQDRLAIVREQLRGLEQQNQQLEVNPASIGVGDDFAERLDNVRKLYDSLVKEADKS